MLRVVVAFAWPSERLTRGEDKTWAPEFFEIVDGADLPIDLGANTESLPHRRNTRPGLALILFAAVRSSAVPIFDEGGETVIGDPSCRHSMKRSASGATTTHP